MTAITAKSTKAELLTALQEANDELDLLREAYYTAQPITKNQIQLAVQTVVTEFKALVSDVYKFGAWCRKGSQPILDKAMMIVKK